MRSVRRALTLLGLASILSALWATGCENPVAAFTGLTSTSSAGADQHRHRVTIPARDIEQHDADKIYTTTAAGGGPHTHTVTVTAEQLLDLNQDGAFVSVDSSPAGAPAHSHNFEFVR